MRNPLAILWRNMVRTTSEALLHSQQLTPEARLGQEGEEAAYWYLRQQSFIMVSRNYRPEGLRGEIDLIGWEGNTLVFVEVKTRSPSPLREPETAVDRDKMDNLEAAARRYRQRARCFSATYRFDIISVIHSENGSEIRHFRDAFRNASFARSPA